MSNGRQNLPEEARPAEQTVYQVVLPVSMSRPLDKSTLAYLQHSMAPMPSNNQDTIRAIFNGPFPSAGRTAAFQAPFLPPLTTFPMPGQVPAPGQNPASVTPVAQPSEVRPSADVKLATPQPPASYGELTQMIREFGSRIPLPNADAKSFEADFPLELGVDKDFVNNTPLANMLALVEYTCRRLKASAPAEPDPTAPISMVDVAKHILKTLSAINELPGWSYAEKHIKNPPNSIMDEQLAKGTLLLKRLCMRINWVLQLHTKDGMPPDPDTYMQLISADKQWAADANLFMKETDAKVTEMLTENSATFHAFREQQRKGVQWPHSAAARKNIEAASFVFRPMMIKRDRCVCETCQVEVSGWRPWQNAWAYHDYSRHMPVFLEKARSACFNNPVVMQVLDAAKARIQAATAARSPASFFGDSSPAKSTLVAKPAGNLTYRPWVKRND